MNYSDFLNRKTQLENAAGFEPLWMPEFLFDFQAQPLVGWGIRMGRAAIFADCGLGKTPMQLVWSQNTVMKTNKPGLILSPLAVSFQIVRRSGTNPIPVSHPIGLTHYAGERQVPPELEEFRGHKGNQIENAYSQWIWRQYASCNWDDIRIDNTLGSGAGIYSGNRAEKDESDEKHMHPLQLDVIERAVVMWSNPGETVLTPFMGIGSEVYGSVLNGRRGVGIELKAGYYRQAVKNLEAAASVAVANQDQPAERQMTIEDMIK